MSVSKWAYSPEKCDGDYCPGDCDYCDKAEEDGLPCDICEHQYKLENEIPCCDCMYSHRSYFERSNWMKIKLHSQYNHFPYCQTDQDDFNLEMWNDGKIWEYLADYPSKNRGSALMIEPRSLQPDNYILLESAYDKFDNVFTHDSQLLSLLPNAYPIIYWRGYELNDEPKTKKISFICGDKEMCSYHIMRKKLAEVLKDRVDVLGDWNGGERVSTHDAYAPYKFAIVIENYIDNLWFTEKILNCFSNKTIPIYFGAKDIDAYFNKNGIIQVDNIWEIPEVIDEYWECFDEMYLRLRYAIEDNYQRVQKYIDFEDWFIQNYGEEE